MNLLQEYKKGKKLSFFRYKQLNKKVLLSNDSGDFVILSDIDFSSLIRGSLKNNKKKTSLYKKLSQLGMVEFDGKTEEAIVSKWKGKNAFLFGGPTLHIVVLTNKCNLSCVYCHAGARATGSDMTVETAKAVLKTIFSAPTKVLTIEFQGGEPLLNWDALSYIVTESRKMEQDKGKKLEITVVTNLTKMTSEKYDFLKRYNVTICTSLDGDKSTHNKNRPFSAEGNDSYSYVSKWLKLIREDFGPKYNGGAITTITRNSLTKWKQIADEYVKLGMKVMFVRFLNPFGAAKKAWDRIGYTPEEYLQFYKNLLDYIIELNLKDDIEISENYACLFLRKIFGSNDPNYLDLRSPCGAGIGQIAYNCDGKVYTCDEGRMLAAMGDTSFCIGEAGKNSYNRLLSSPTVKSVVTASVTDIQPVCSDCAYKPYCGVCPVFNYSEHNDLFMYSCNFRCKVHSGILDYLFLKQQDNRVKKLFMKWLKQG